MALTTKRIQFYFGLTIAVIVLFYLLSQVFSGRIILPQTFSLGMLTVHYYGLIMALAVAIGFNFALKRTVLYGIRQSEGENLIFWIVIGGFIGARIYHVFSSFGYYQNNPVDIFKVWNGGLSIYGALLGGFFVIWLFADKILHFKSSILKVLDWLTPSLVLGQIIGRFGNLFNYEAYGYPTNLPWKMFVPQQFRPDNFLSAQFFHPIFLYEVFGNILILLLLYLCRKKQFNLVFGSLFLWYLLLYNSLRFFLEFMRIDSIFIGNFRLNAISSLLLIIFGIILIFVKNHKCLKNIK